MENYELREYYGDGYEKPNDHCKWLEGFDLVAFGDGWYETKEHAIERLNLICPKCNTDKWVVFDNGFHDLLCLECNHMWDFAKKGNTGQLVNGLLCDGSEIVGVIIKECGDMVCIKNEKETRWTARCVCKPIV
jgi:hypothetical protein